MGIRKLAWLSTFKNLARNCAEPFGYACWLEKRRHFEPPNPAFVLYEPISRWFSLSKSLNQPIQGNSPFPMRFTGATPCSRPGTTRSQWNASSGRPAY